MNRVSGRGPQPHASTPIPLADDLVLLAVDPERRRIHAPSLDYLLAAADLGDAVLAGDGLPADVYRAIRNGGGPTRGARSDRTVAALITGGTLGVQRGRRFGIVPVEEVDLLDRARRAELVADLTNGLRHASTLPLRLGFEAALLSAGGIAGDVLPREAQTSADDLAAGVVELVADPRGAVATLADALREALDSLG